MTIALITEGFVAPSTGGGGGGFTPAITAVSPTPNTTPGTGGGMPARYADARNTPIVVQITDAGGDGDLELVTISAVFLNGAVETAYRGSNFLGAYILNSYPISITNGRELHILRDGGWPGATSSGSNLAVGLIIDAVDAGGTLTSAALYYQMPLTTQPAPAPSIVALGAIDLVAHGLDRLIWQLRS